MSDSEKMSIASLMYVSLRRLTSRIIDVEWMMHNQDYAKEIIALARRQGNVELQHYAERMEELLGGKTSPPRPAVVAAPVDDPLIDPISAHHASEDSAIASRYIGSLR